MLIDEVDLCALCEACSVESVASETLHSSFVAGFALGVIVQRVANGRNLNILSYLCSEHIRQVHEYLSITSPGLFTTLSDDVRVVRAAKGFGSRGKFEKPS